MKLINRDRFFAVFSCWPIAISVISVVVSLSRGNVIAPPKCGFRSCSRCVFPFRFGGQPIALASLGGQPFGVVQRVNPTDVDDGPFASASILIICWFSSAFSHTKTVVFIKSHGVLPDSKGLPNRDSMPTFINTPTGFIFRRSNPEFTRWKGNHGWAVAAILQPVTKRREGFQR